MSSSDPANSSNPHADGDALSRLIDQVGLRARTFFTGTACDTTTYAARDDGVGHLHLLRHGTMSLWLEDGRRIELGEPTLVVLGRSSTHTMDTSREPGADLVCAEIELGLTGGSPLLVGFPEILAVPLAAVPGLGKTLDLLFQEAFGEQFGRQAALDRLIELLLVLLLRHCVATGRFDVGLLAGLADPRLARALERMHAAPDRHWTLERLAEAAGMSRASFAATFKARVSVPPGDYLTMLRLAAAARGLRDGLPLKTIAARTGYGSATALARAFRQRYGESPGAWGARARGA
ncbi:MAG: AraC family transcriptional regulator [Ectothiorhodospiraceae bacterium]|nr:AraC family transcriptional regulator [Ectothiorhodospiraceae bacterium]